MSEGLTMSQLQERNALLVTENESVKAQRDALAAENAARAEIIERMIGQYSAAGYHAVQNSLNPAQSLLYDAMQVLKQPATDAWLNSVRAEGVEMAASDLFEKTAIGHGMLMAFAAQLRAGEPS